MSRTASAVLASLMVSLLMVHTAPAGAQGVQAVIDYRQSVMQGLQMHTGALRALRSGAVDFEGHVLAHALAVQGLADMLPPLFPAGSGDGETRALSTVWSSPAEFATAVASLRSAAADLVTAARSGDGAMIDAARTAVGQTCTACHGEFRERPARGGGRGG